MTTEVTKNIREIYTRLFDQKPFLSAEIKYFAKEFEEKRNDREVENLFDATEITTEIKNSSIERCLLASTTHLPVISTKLDQTLKDCDILLNRKIDPELENQLIKNRASRKEIWQVFVDDMTHKCSRIDNTFEEKEEELREFYSDLERKLHIHK